MIAPDGLAALAVTMLADALAAEVVQGLQAAGVQPILLKGSSIADRLYPDGGRPYVDADLLIAPADFPRAELALAGMGLRRDVRLWEQPDYVEHDAPWRRPGEPTPVDLHRTLPGVCRAAPQEVWQTLARHALPRPLPGCPVTVRTLDDAGIALVLVLHLAHHRGQPFFDCAKPIADLERALDLLPPRAWQQAADLAGRLRCEGQFARGLCAVPRGTAMVQKLGLPRRGPRAVARRLVRALAPPPAWIRWNWPLARRGRLGLAAAYLLRPAVVVIGAIAPAQQRRASRRRARA